MTSLYDIIKAPDPVLKQTAQTVSTVDDTVQNQIDKMFATMYDAPGIGLAANQVGLLNRILVMDVPEGSWIYTGEDKNGVLQIGSPYRSGENQEEEPPKRNPIVMVNPEIVQSSEQHSVFEEGCLSIPGQHADVERPAKVTVEYLNYDGEKKTLEAEGLVSHCVQHEIDHLNGVLFIDYLSSLKRGMIIRKMEKLKKQGII